MTSTDREILIAIQGELGSVRKELATIKISLDEQGKRIARIESKQDEQEARLVRMELKQDNFVTELRHTNDKIDWMQHSLYWGFAVIAIVIAYCTGVPRHKTSDEKSPAQNDNVPAIIQSVIDVMRFTRESDKH